MADDDTLGTAALRRTVAATRANAGAVNAMPAPPPDAVSAPWMAPWQQPAPNGLPAAIAQPKRAALRAPQPPKPARQSGHRTSNEETAWDLAHGLLKQYGQEMDRNIGKADLHLAQGLMKNGTLLIRHGVPMDALGALIRLARDLAHNTETESQEDPRIDQLRSLMERKEVDLPDLSAVDLTYKDDDNGDNEEA